MKKKLFSIVGAISAAVMTFSFAACGGNGDTEAKVGSYVNLDINPAIELTVDTNNKVMSVYAANQDAQVLLYEENGIQGADIEVAVEKITDLAIEYGYLEEGNTVVGTSVTSLTGKGEELLAKIEGKVTATAEKLGLSVTTDTQGSYSLMRKYNAFKEKYASNPVVQALTIEKFNLALSASETGEITLEAAVELNDEALVKLLSEAHAKVEKFATDAYNKAKDTAFAIYDKAVGAVMDSVYTVHYMKPENLIAHYDTFWYGVAYQGYKAAARGFEGIADLLVYAEDIASYPIDQAAVEEILAIFGVETTVEDLKDEDGNITIESVEAYADKLFKNSEASAVLEQVKAELTTIINQAESTIQTKIKEAVEEYGPQITTVTASVETAIGTVETTVTINPMIPEAIKTQFNAFVDGFEEIIDEIEELVEDGEINQAKLREYAEKFEKKAAETLKLIEEDLSEEELAEVTANAKELEETLASARTTFENALNKAETQAKEYLAQLKAARKTA